MLVMSLDSKASEGWDCVLTTITLSVQSTVSDALGILNTFFK